MHPIVRNALLSLAPAALLAQGGCSGCGGPLAAQDGAEAFGGLDVATEGQPGGQSEGQMDSQSMAYLWARPTSAVVLCVRAPCPSYEVRAVDGHESKLVHQFDLRALGLSQKERDQLMGHMGQTLARGRYAKARFQGQDIVVFQVTRAAEPAGTGGIEKPTTDGYYHVTVSGACPTDSCLEWKAKPLKGGAAATWNGLDLSGIGLPQDKANELLREFRSRGGYVSATATPSGTQLITQAFRAP